MWPQIGTARDRLELRMIRRDARADEAERGRKHVEQVDLEVRARSTV
jgi:hypothetical protein